MNRSRLLCIVLGLSAMPPTLSAEDWPQLAKDAGRTARTADSVAPPYRARWIWVGPDRPPLRNRRSEPGWPHDLDSRDGYSFPMPPTVNFTLAESVQPVLADGRLFFGSQEGWAFAVRAFDGETLWNSELPGGTFVSAAVSGDVVAFVSVTGVVRAFDVATGALRWGLTLPKASTTAPCAVGSTFVVADHGGYVTALQAATGAQLWRTRLPAPVLGGIASDGQSVYVPAENMFVYALRLSDGGVRGSFRVRGQSFRMTHPVVHQNLLWVQSASVPCWGSEYTMQEVMASATSIADEEAKIRRWLTGDTNGGQWPDATPDWKHLFAIRTSDMTEAFVPAVGPVDGCGMPPMPPAIGPRGRPIVWLPTKFPRLTGLGAFGTSYSIDLCEIDTTNGNRIPIDNGRLSGMWMIETDNLYALTVAGQYIWMRQWFRGTQVIRLTDSWHSMVSNRVRYEDGAGYTSDVIYFQTPDLETRTPQPMIMGRAAPIVVGSRLYQQESYAVVCLEHDQR